MTIAFTRYGFSSEAEHVDKMVQQNRDYLQKSSAFGIESLLRDELAEAWAECQTGNWDGYDAEPVSQVALRNMYIFLEALPLGLCRPSVSADPHGHLTLEWYRNPTRVLSVAVSPDDLVHYSALLGASKTCGTETFFGEVPEIIINLVHRVYS